jgi:DNA-binding transcriptional MerR regulator
MENRNYSQITFEFSDVPANQEAISSVGVGVRVKSLKAEAVEPAKNEAPATEAIETTNAAETADATEVTGQAQVPVKKSTRGRKSLKALDAEADLVNIPDDETLFQRQYYSIGEVADMFGVNQSLLRFWENEFDIIQPRKNRKGDRHFRPVDIKNLELIYDLLRRRKLTIEGAKDFLKKNSKAKEHFEMIQSLQSLKGFLLEIKAAL